MHTWEATKKMILFFKYQSTLIVIILLLLPGSVTGEHYLSLSLSLSSLFPCFLFFVCRLAYNFTMSSHWMEKRNTLTFTAPAPTHNYYRNHKIGYTWLGPDPSSIKLGKVHDEAQTKIENHKWKAWKRRRFAPWIFGSHLRQKGKRQK